MDAAWWTVSIMGGTALAGWCTFIARLLWNFRGKWDETNAALTGLRDKISALAERDAAIEMRLERHLDWHDRH